MIATRIRNTTTMPPAIATLSRRSRIQAICPSDRPSMALPGTDNGAPGDGPPGPVATSIGTAIDKHQSLARNKSPTSANPGPLETAAERLAFLIVRLRHFADRH